MASGIYMLTFPSGHFYIGKAEDMEKRWSQHAKDFADSKHTKKMQAIYDQYGPPKNNVLYEIHADHLDLIEGMCIAVNYDDPLCLNGNRPKCPSKEDFEILEQHIPALQSSTADHIRYILQETKRLEEVASNLESTADRLQELEEFGIVIPDEVDEKIQELQEALEEKNKELERLSKLSWFDRLFQFRVNK